jgi:hypothetical protein
VRQVASAPPTVKTRPRSPCSPIGSEFPPEEQAAVGAGNIDATHLIGRIRPARACFDEDTREFAMER